MPYLTESEVRRAAKTDYRVVTKSYSEALRESASTPLTAKFDVFLSHSVTDAELVHGAKKILEDRRLTVYVDWIVDRQLDREKVTPATAEVLRVRMRNSASMLYLYTQASKSSRWMPWELGFFDACNGTVGVLPVASDRGDIDFTKEEFVGLYPKVDLDDGDLVVHRTKTAPVSIWQPRDRLGFRTWMTGSEKLKLAS